MANGDREDQDYDLDVGDDDTDEQQSSDEELERAKRALKKANAEAKKYRLRLKEYLKNNDADNENNKSSISQERIREEVSEAEESRWKGRMVRQAAKAALLEAGLQGDATKLARLVDENDVEIDDDGEIVDGLEEQIDSIKEDYPELFEEQTKANRRTRIDGSDRGGRPQRRLTTAEMIQEKALRTKVR